MIVVDVNLLVYSHRSEMVEHGEGAAWLIELAGGDETFALTSATVAGFVRVVTNHRVFPEPSSTDVACMFVEELAASPVCRWIEPGERWWSRFDKLARQTRARGNVVPDAQLAALTIEHGARLATADHGFARFGGLEWFDPLLPT